MRLRARIAAATREIDFDVTETLLPYYGGDDVTWRRVFCRGLLWRVLDGDDLVTDTTAISTGPCDWQLTLMYG